MGQRFCNCSLFGTQGSVPELSGQLSTFPLGNDTTFQALEFPSKIKQIQALTSGTWSALSALLFDFPGRLF